MRASGPLLSPIQIANRAQWRNRNGRLPLNSEIQSTAFMTGVRLSSTSSLMLRETVWRKMRLRLAQPPPGGGEQLHRRRGADAQQVFQVGPVDDDGAQVLGDLGRRRAGAAVEERISPKKSPGPRRLEHDPLAGVVLEEISTSPARTM